MLVITREQTNAMSQQCDALAQAHLAQHLRSFAPAHVAAVPPAGLQELVHRCVHACRTLGWHQRGPMELYAEMTVLLGASFATDPMAAWAAPLLVEGDKPMAAADELAARSQAYYRAVVGPGFEFELVAIDRCLSLEAALQTALDGLHGQALVKLLARCYPEKAAYVGLDVVELLAERAARACAQAGARGSAAGALLGGLMFILGHGCMGDPQYPWVAPAMRQAVQGDSAGGLRLLMRFLRHARATLLH